MMRVRILSGLLLLASLGSASAQSPCNGQPASGLVCGNPTAAATLPSWATQTALIDRAFTASQGQILNRGASVWTSTATPSLGKNGGTGGALTLNGATSGSATIGVKPVAGTSIVFNLPITNGSLNNVLVTDGSGNLSWAAAGGGTVSSVGLSMPGIFTVTNSPVTSTGTLTATLNTQSANQVWAGPTTGAASSPTFRALVGADLPNPSTSSLGGVQAINAVTSNWIRSISTSGVPALSQPAFTDISGTAAAAQLPNPTASTLGGIESYAAVSHQWINTISTSGVPGSTQPAFTDVAGQASLAQLPGIGNNTILSNIAGGSATPLANSLSAIIDSAIGSAQGDVLYRNGSTWTALTPGTGGQVLTTGGAAANLSWTTVTGTGTVTNIATNNGVTGGPITTTGTIGLSSISTGNVLANVTGGSAVPTATTPSAIIDTIGSVQGDILYRGALTWGVLAPGTNGQYLQTAGVGSTPSWASAVASLGAATGALDVPAAISSGRALTNADCENPLLLGNNTQFTMTVNAPSAYSCNRFKLINSDTYTGSGTGRGKIISATLNSGVVKFWLYPGQTVDLVQFSSSAWASSQQIETVDGVSYVKRWIPNHAVVCTIDSSGSDSNGDCLQTGGAGSFKTLQHCVNFIESVLDNGVSVTQPTCGPTGGQTINESVTLAWPPIGTNTINIAGQGSAFTWTPSSSPALLAGNNSNVQLSNITFNGTSSSCFPNCNFVQMHNMSVVEPLTGVTCNNPGSSGNCFMSDSGTAGGAQLNIDNGLTVTGAVSSIVRLNQGSRMMFAGALNGVSVTSVARSFTNLGGMMCFIGSASITGTFPTAAGSTLSLNGGMYANQTSADFSLGGTVATALSNFASGFAVTTGAGGC